MTQPSSLPVPLLVRWSEFSGKYQGEGLNHLGEAFWGVFHLTSSLDRALLMIRFRALENAPTVSLVDSGTAFHDEHTWITEDLIQRKIGLWTVSTNTPGVLKHELTAESRDGSYLSSLQFSLGDPQDRSRFRQRIELSARADGGIEYVYSWGVPHEDFGVRSRCLLRKTDN